MNSDISNSRAQQPRDSSAGLKVFFLTLLGRIQPLSGDYCVAYELFRFLFGDFNTVGKIRRDSFARI